MKTRLIVAVAAFFIAIVGCKTIPSDDKMYIASYAIGASAGLVADMTKIDDVSRNKTVEIINIANANVPQTNETFTAAWTPIANRCIEQWVKSGEINAAQGILIAKTFDIVCNGIDYVFDVRHPNARQHLVLVEAAVHGFSAGFLNTFKPANNGLFAAKTNVEIDGPAYKCFASKYLK